MRSSVAAALLALLPLGPLAAQDARVAARDAKVPFYPDKSRLLVYLDSAGGEHPITAAAQWEKRREHILANMQLVMGPLSDAAKKVPLAVETRETVDLGKLVRKKILYCPEPGDRVPAYLFVPKGLPGKVPAVLCLHQTIAIGKGEPAGLDPGAQKPYARELAERGYVTLAPDYPNYGEYQFDPYAHGYASATMKGIWNHVRAVDLLQSLPEVDPERIAVIGHSLGGHNAMFVAAFDRRIKAIVSSCGFNAFAKYYRGDLTGWSHKGYMPRIASAYGKDPKRMPFDFTEIVGALAPRPFFVNAPLGDDNFEKSGVDDCLRAARPVYELLGGKESLVAVHPNIGHGFPPEIRRAAYEFLDRALKRRADRLTDGALGSTFLSGAQYPDRSMKTLSLKLPEPLYAKLAVAARQRGQTRSAVIRQLLEEYLDGNGGVRPGSCLELAADLLGCMQGPRDLSCGKRHLRGYGQ